MQRFYLKNVTFKQSLIIDNKDLVHQISVVLRSRIWDYFVFFDWINFVDKIYRLQLITKNALEFKFVEDREKNNEVLDMTLYQALPNKLEKIEYIIQKWTEIWFTRFVFFRSERSQKLVISDNKKDRLQNIIAEASEQSWRNIVPELYILDKLDFTLLEKKETLFFHTINLDSKKLNDINLDKKNINLVVWPEWWWSEFEIKDFEKLWFTKVFLWDNVLRCETVSGVVGFYILQEKTCKNNSFVI